MQNRVDPFHLDLIRQCRIFTDKCCDPVICLIFDCQYFHINLIIQTFQQIFRCIGNVINLCTADINISVCFRNLTDDQIQYDNDCYNQHRHSYTVGTMLCSGSMEHSF